MAERTGAAGRSTALLLAALASAGTFAPAGGQSLRGSKSSLVKQNAAARKHDFTYLRTGSAVREFARKGLLVQLAGNDDYRLASVSYPYARPELKLFVERLAGQYRKACGERLVVTSLTRPWSGQPRNASNMSVHPTGMAADLRRSWDDDCRDHIEGTLLALERRGVLEATRESFPPHYHVTLFPSSYRKYLEARGVRVHATLAKTHKVSRGETLWTIARRHGTSVDELKKANRMSSSHLLAGQVLQIPEAR